MAVIAGLLAIAGLAYLVIEDSGDTSSKSSSTPKAFRGSKLPPALIGKPAFDFRLADARGGEIATRRLRGKPYVVTFLYTDCEDVCPLIGRELGQALRLLGSQRNDVAILAVSADPEGDTPAAVKEWLRRHRLPTNFHYLIGPERRLRPVWKGYYAARQDPRRQQSSHTASIWLIDAEGRIRTKFSAGVPVPPADIAHDLKVLADEA